MRKLVGDQHGFNCTVPSVSDHLAQLEAERARRAAEERKQRQEAMRRDMIAANQLQLQLKARGWAVEWWLWWSNDYGRERTVVSQCSSTGSVDTVQTSHVSTPPYRRSAVLRRRRGRTTSGAACWLGWRRRTGWSR